MTPSRKERPAKNGEITNLNSLSLLFIVAKAEEFPETIIISNCNSEIKSVGKRPRFSNLCPVGGDEGISRNISFFEQ